MTSSSEAVGQTKTAEQLTFTFDELAVSPLNVRFNEEDCEAVEALASSIVGEGLIQPLSLHPVPEGADWADPDERNRALGQDKPARFGIYAGGRRYRAIRLAIEDGRLPRDFPIAARVRDLTPGEIVLASLDENLQRRDLRAYEVHRALANAQQLGMTPAQIAYHTGQSAEWVARQLRLGDLHPDVFAAYMEGRISGDQAKAYAATDDTELQAEAFAHFRPLARYEESPAAIRGYMKVGDGELKRLLLFVGEAVYRGRGGRFELDLFADGPDSDRDRVVDEDLLRELAEEKLASIRKGIRGKLGESDLRFQHRPPQFGGRDDVAIELEMSGFTRGNWNAMRIPLKIPASAIVATIEIDREGEPIARFWWESRKAKGEHTSKPVGRVTTTMQPTEGEALSSQGIGYDIEARRIVRDDHGLTADGLNICRSLRRDLLRATLLAAAVAEDDRYWIPRDYLTWSQLRIELTNDRDTFTGARGLAAEGWTEAEREPTELLRGQREGQPMADAWDRARAVIEQHEAFTLEDAPAAFRAFLAADHDFKALAEALLAGLALIRSANTPGYRVPAHDALAQVLGVTPESMRDAWTPTPAFTGLFGKMKRLELAQPFIDPAAFKGWPSLKDKPLTGATAAALQGVAEGQLGDDAKRWVHPLLAFEPVTQPDSPEDEEREQDPGPDDEAIPDEVMTAQVAEPAE